MPIGDFPERLAANARFAMPHRPRTLHRATGENKGKKHHRRVTVAAYRAGPPLHGRPSLYLTATGPRCRRPNRSVAPAAASHGRVNLAQLRCLRPPLLDSVVARLRHLHSIIGKVEGKKRGGTNEKKGSGNRGGDVGHCRCCLHRRSATPRLAHRAGRRRPHRLTSHAPLERRNQRKRK